MSKCRCCIRLGESAKQHVQADGAERLRGRETERMISLMDPISPPIRELLDLFTTSLADVKFGDLDAGAFEAQTAEVRAAAAHLAAVQTSLEAARASFEAQQDALQQMAQRAMAYARVYAENNGALTATLEGIALPRVMKKAPRTVMSTSPVEAVDGAVAAAPDSAPRRRGRARKDAESSQEQLAVGNAE